MVRHGSSLNWRVFRLVLQCCFLSLQTFCNHCWTWERTLITEVLKPVRLTIVFTWDHSKFSMWTKKGTYTLILFQPKWSLLSTQTFSLYQDCLRSCCKCKYLFAVLLFSFLPFARMVEAVYFAGGNILKEHSLGGESIAEIWSPPSDVETSFPSVQD